MYSTTYIISVHNYISTQSVGFYLFIRFTYVHIRHVTLECIIQIYRPKILICNSYEYNLLTFIIINVPCSILMIKRLRIGINE